MDVFVFCVACPALQFFRIATSNDLFRRATGLAISLLAFALLFSTTLAFFLMPVALKKLEASTVSVFMNLQPVVASVVAIAVGQDTFSGDKPLAALLVLTGVYLVSTQSPAQKTKVCR
ncbi:MAG: EamA family transporter [Saprospiraceae bacterium]